MQPKQKIKTRYPTQDVQVKNKVNDKFSKRIKFKAYKTIHFPTNMNGVKTHHLSVLMIEFTKTYIFQINLQTFILISFNSKMNQ